MRLTNHVHYLHRQVQPSLNEKVIIQVMSNILPKYWFLPRSFSKLNLENLGMSRHPAHIAWNIMYYLWYKSNKLCNDVFGDKIHLYQSKAIFTLCLEFWCKNEKEWHLTFIANSIILLQHYSKYTHHHQDVFSLYNHRKIDNDKDPKFQTPYHPELPTTKTPNDTTTRSNTNIKDLHTPATTSTNNTFTNTTPIHTNSPINKTITTNPPPNITQYHPISPKNYLAAILWSMIITLKEC